MRARSLRAALRALPEPDRQGLGAELEGTVLDAQPQSWPRFVGELLHVVRFGATRRATLVARAGIARTLLDGARLGTLTVCAILMISAPVAVFAPLGAPPTPIFLAGSLVLLTGVLGLGLTGADRAAGAAGVFWIMHPLLLGDLDTWRFGPNLLLLLLFATMIAFPRNARWHPRRLAWLNLPVWLLVLGTTGTTAQTIGGVLLVGGLLGMALLGLAYDPRWTIVACVVVAYTLSIGPSTAASTLLVTLAAATAWVTAAWFTRVRRPAPGSLA